jgi:hypothetical protein
VSKLCYNSPTEIYIFTNFLVLYPRNPLKRGVEGEQMIGEEDGRKEKRTVWREIGEEEGEGWR